MKNAEVWPIEIMKTSDGPFSNFQAWQQARIIWLPVENASIGEVKNDDGENF